MTPCKRLIWDRKQKAEHEFEIYRAKQMRELESDFDRMLKSLEQEKDNNHD